MITNVNLGIVHSKSIMIDKIRKTIDSANINFLIGAGFSRPFLDVLHDIESFLSNPSKTDSEISDKKKEYFTKCMQGNLLVCDEVVNARKDEVLDSYKDFYRLLNAILLNRESSILTKQINIFTTNIDIFSEKALEETGIEFNDGFHGRFSPIFNLGNFKKSYFKKSLHYENTSEIPVFNIIKLHGSLTWKHNNVNENVVFDKNLDSTRNVKAKLASPDFDEAYKQLLIVNPTKQKFEDTLLNQYYYDLLRIYSNELEKENSVLFVAGFSFADEHIRDLTARVAASNPTLKIYIFAHSSTTDIYEKLKNEAKNKNIEVLLPTEGEKYNLATINSNVLSKIIEQPSDRASEYDDLA